jgi:hypothetical protein
LTGSMENPVLLRRERLLLAPPEAHPWWRSHAQCPTVLALGASLWRVYFAARNAGNQSHIIYADFDPSEDMRLLRLEAEPLLEPGAPGTFGSAGMGPSSALFVGTRVFLYYVGFSLRRDVPHQLAIGLAVSEDGGATFRRAVPGPVLSTGPFDPFFSSTPHVEYRDGAFGMHYMSGIAWQRHGDRFDPLYLIKRAVSSDGIRWTTDDDIAVGFADKAETALARPWVIRRNDGHHMWFCRRGMRDSEGRVEDPYLLGYARSRDGLSWSRADELLRFANPPRSGEWDSAMQAYPCVVTRGDELLLFYNGDGFGQTGFGFARILMPE